MEEKKDSMPIILYLVLNLAGGAIFGIIFSALGKSILEAGIIATLVLNIILAIILVLVYRNRLKEDIKKLNNKTIIKVVLIGVAIIVLNEILTNLLLNLGVNFSNQDTLGTMLESYKIPMSIYIALIAPFVEEFTFRYSLGTLIKNKVVFILASGIIFGLFHTTGIDIIVYILIGSVLAYIYLKNDKNIICPIIIHVLNNVLSLVISLFL